jgi:hypothetical protein
MNAASRSRGLAPVERSAAAQTLSRPAAVSLGEDAVELCVTAKASAIGGIEEVLVFSPMIFLPESGKPERVSILA